jgi:hypothetical protein
MGRIMPRFREHLGSADASIIKARRELLAAVKTLTENGTPPPASQDPSLYRVRPCETILTPTDDWQTKLDDWHHMRTDQYPNEEYMLPRWNRGGGPGGRPRQEAQREEPIQARTS